MEDANKRMRNTVQEGITAQRRLDEFAEEIVRDHRGEQAKTFAPLFLEKARLEMRKWRRYLWSRFGVRVWKKSRCDYRRVPRIPDEAVMKWNAAHECFHWETVYGVMRPPVERGEYEEAIEGYAEAVRASLALDFYLPAVAPFEEWEIRAAVEAGNGYPAYLFGYAGAGLSLQQNPRLKRALIKSSGRQPWDALLREIPSAVLLGIEQVEGVIPNLPRAVIRLLEGLGDKEAPKRQLAAEFADPDLAEFERQHSLAQDLVRLRQALEQVKFSKRQREVYEADVETDRDTHEIARRLGISPDQVRKHRERYTDKLREQIEAD